MNRRKFFGVLAAAPASVAAMPDTSLAARVTMIEASVVRGRTFVRGFAPFPCSIGDLWIDTADSNKVYKWNGTAWVTPDAV